MRFFPGRMPSGFSLIELMVVLALMGLALLVGTPAMQSYLGSQRIQDAGDGLIARFDLARQMAVAGNNPVEIVFDEDQSAYRIHDDDNGDGVQDNGERLLGPYPLGAGIGLDVSTLAGDGRIVFQPSGLLQPGQGGTIGLSDGEEKSLVLEVFNSGTIQPQS